MARTRIVSLLVPLSLALATSAQDVSRPWGVPLPSAAAVAQSAPGDLPNLPPRLRLNPGSASPPPLLGSQGTFPPGMRLLPPEVLRRLADQGSTPSRDQIESSGRTVTGAASRNPIFLTAPIYASNSIGAVSVAVGDFNGDGKPDLAVANHCVNSSNCTSGGVSVLLGNGDGSYKTASSYASGGYVAESVAVGDFNGDGKLDLAVSNYCMSSSSCQSTSGSGVVGVLLGNGDGTFRAAVSYASGGYAAVSVAIGDLNADGKPDVIVANSCGNISSCPSGGLVSVLLGNGDGTFRAAMSYASGGYAANSLAIGDLDGDGKTDVMVANFCVSSSDCSAGVVSVLMGLGDGTFQAAVSYGSGGYHADSVAVGDFNGDGKPDLAVANSCVSIFCGSSISGNVSVLLGNGNGTFQAAVSYSSLGGFTESVALGDFNGDGRLDLALASDCVTNSSTCTNGGVSVLLGNGDGTFRAAVSYASGGVSADSVVVGDFNGDGKLDLAVANYMNLAGGVGPVELLLGNGNGTYKAARSYGSGGAAADYSVAVGDFNGDGKRDLVVANFCLSGSNCPGGDVSVLLGNGDGTFRAAVSYASGGYGAVSVAVGDFNGDGKPDLVVANTSCLSSNCTGGDVSVLLGNGDGTFQAAVSYASGGQYADSVAVGDFNGDGKLDLAVANLCVSGSTDCGLGVFDGAVSVLLGNGDGTFHAAVSYPSGGVSAYSVAVGDFNGDGKPDLVVSNGDGIGLLLGNGNGTFQAAVSNSSGGGTFVVVGDFNRDRKLDLAVANGSEVSVRLGNGDGTFQPAVIYPSGNGAVSVAVGDFNGDGKPDLAVTSRDGTGLLLGNGAGTFEAAIRFSVGGFSLAVGDFNRDGKPDLAIAGTVVLLNIATGFRYATATSLTSSANPASFNQSVTLTARVTPAFRGTPTGTITFHDSGYALATVPISNLRAKFSTSSLTVGRHSITTSYSGDGNFLLSTSPKLIEMVIKAKTRTKLTSSRNPSTSGQSVTFTALLKGEFGRTPTGAVAFKNGPTTLATVKLSGAKAAFVTSSLSVGLHSITAIYAGDTDYQASTSAVLKQTVKRR